MLLDSFEQDWGLDAVARTVGLGSDQPALDRILDGGHDELYAELGDPAVPEAQYLRKVVPGVDMHDGKRNGSRTERLLREPEHDDRVFAPGEQQDRTLQLCGDLAHDVTASDSRTSS